MTAPLEFDRCPGCGVPVAHRHADGCPSVHRARAAISAGLLIRDLREAAAAGHADACDLQLLAALDRWSAGEIA